MFKCFQLINLTRPPEMGFSVFVFLPHKFHLDITKHLVWHHVQAPFTTWHQRNPDFTLTSFPLDMSMPITSKPPSIIDHGQWERQELEIVNFHDLSDLSRMGLWAQKPGKRLKSSCFVTLTLKRGSATLLEGLVASYTCDTTIVSCIIIWSLERSQLKGKTHNSPNWAST